MSRVQKSKISKVLPKQSIAKQIIPQAGDAIGELGINPGQFFPGENPLKSWTVLRNRGHLVTQLQDSESPNFEMKKIFDGDSDTNKTQQLFKVYPTLSRTNAGVTFQSILDKRYKD